MSSHNFRHSILPYTPLNVYEECFISLIKPHFKKKKNDENNFFCKIKFKFHMNLIS